MSSAYVVITYKHNINYAHAAGVGKEDGKRMLANCDFVVDGGLMIEAAETIVHRQMDIILARLNKTKGMHMLTKVVVLIHPSFQFFLDNFDDCFFFLSLPVEKEHVLIGDSITKAKREKKTQNFMSSRNGTKKTPGTKKKKSLNSLAKQLGSNSSDLVSSPSASSSSTRSLSRSTKS